MYLFTDKREKLTHIHAGIDIKTKITIDVSSYLGIYGFNP